MPEATADTRTVKGHPAASSRRFVQSVGLIGRQMSVIPGYHYGMPRNELRRYRVDWKAVLGVLNSPVKFVTDPEPRARRSSTPTPVSRACAGIWLQPGFSARPRPCSSRYSVLAASAQTPCVLRGLLPFPRDHIRNAPRSKLPLSPGPPRECAHGLTNRLVIRLP